MILRDRVEFGPKNLIRRQDNDLWEVRDKDLQS